MKGKVLVLFTNEPPSDDPKFFGGRALTYYGRWTYKYEEAARHGAKAVFIIHTTPTAGYGWDVVRSSWGGEDPQLKLAPGQPALAFAGWFTHDAGEKLLAMSGHHVDELLQAANSRDFHPIPLGIHIRGNMPTKIRKIESRNVVAMVPGSDAKLQIGSSGIHRALGSSGNRSGREWRFHLQRRGGQRHRLRHDDRDGARLGRAAAKSRNGRQYLSPSRLKKRGCAGRNITPSIP